MFENLRSLHSARPEQDARNKGLCITTTRCGDGLRVSCAMHAPHHACSGAWVLSDNYARSLKVKQVSNIL